MGNVDVKVSSGQLEVSKEKNLLVWVLGTSTRDFSVLVLHVRNCFETVYDTALFLSLGQKFPKSREVSLEGTVHFSGTVAGPTDPLCTGLTTYIKVRMNSGLLS